jgi:uncharacterized membrane protein YeiH
MSMSKKANLRLVIVMGLTIGAGQGIFRDVTAAHGFMIGLFATMLISAVLALAASWIVGRVMKLQD